MEFKNPFIFDNRPIPVVSIRFRTILNSDKVYEQGTWSSFISRLMREEKSRYKYTQVAIIREAIRKNPEIFSVENVKNFINFYMVEHFEKIAEIFLKLDIDTKAFVLGMSGFNLKSFQQSISSNC